jgi:hypothetical protein
MQKNDQFSTAFKAQINLNHAPVNPNGSLRLEVGSLRLAGIDAPFEAWRNADGANLILDETLWTADSPDSLRARASSVPEPLHGFLLNRIAAGDQASWRRGMQMFAAQLKSEFEQDRRALGRTGSLEVFVTPANGLSGVPLAFVNRWQPEALEPAARPSSYNQRLLRFGAALPYFVWPHLEPFWSKARTDGLLAAVIPPGQARLMADRSRVLRTVLADVHAARLEGRGVHGQGMGLAPFELRLLLERRIPTDWLIDLDGTDDTLIAPQEYFRIPKPENRLFIPEQHRGLFIAAGWRVKT